MGDVVLLTSTATGTTSVDSRKLTPQAKAADAMVGLDMVIFDAMLVAAGKYPSVVPRCIFKNNMPKKRILAAQTACVTTALPPWRLVLVEHRVNVVVKCLNID